MSIITILVILIVRKVFTSRKGARTQRFDYQDNIYLLHNLYGLDYV